MDLKCSIIHKHFFFFFAFVLVPIPKYSATEICWRRCEKGQKSLLAFLEGVPADTVPKELEEMAVAVCFGTSLGLFGPVCVIHERGGVGSGGVFGGGLLWTWPQVIMGFLSLKLWKLIFSKLSCFFPVFDHSNDRHWCPSDRKWLPRGENGSVYFLPSTLPHPPHLSSSWREKKVGVL